jgi:predicted permease
VGSTVLFGVLPVGGVLRRAPLGALGDSGRAASAGPAHAFARRGLVVLQFALALGLAGAAALLGRTLVNLRAIPTGFDLDHVVVVEVDPRAPRPPFAEATGGKPGAAPTAQTDADRVARYVADGVDRLAAAPGVGAAAYARVLPLDFGGSRTTIAIDGYTPGADEDMEINFNLVTAGYFETLSIAPRDGRVFDGRDVRGAPPAAVVNESMARRYWPGQRAVGRMFTVSPKSRYEVVGVVPDVKYRMLREDAGPSFYLAFEQGQPSGGAFHVRTAGSPDAMLDTLRRIVADLDPAVPITRLRTLRMQADLNVNDDRLALTIALGLAGAAILLAAVGLYATMAQAVGRRTREIGVRLALGAAPGDVRRLVLREAVVLAILGSAAGLGLALGAGQLIRERLFGVSATDPLSLAIATAVLAIVALVAAWAPARRAARVDPVEALRVE